MAEEMAHTEEDAKATGGEANAPGAEAKASEAEASDPKAEGVEGGTEEAVDEGPDYGEPDSRETPLILVIDDDRIFRKTIHYVLQRKDKYQVILAENGVEGLELASKHKPDLVICDVMMREMHGYATASALRDTEGIEDVPIIMITGQGSPLGERRAKVHGANYYLYKPIKLPKLMEMIEWALTKREKPSGWSRDIAK